MADGTRLSQMQKEMDLMSNQVGEIAEIKSQIMALTASMNIMSNTMSTLIKDKATSSEQRETHRDRYVEFPRERQHYNEEEYHGGYKKKMVADQVIKKSINSLLKENGCRSNYQEKHVASMEFPRFTNKNPSTWIFKANQFFEHHKTPMEDRIPIAACHMREKALSWFQEVESFGFYNTWGKLVKTLQFRFQEDEKPTQATRGVNAGGNL
jgi:hypothetical protein